ncbi:MAG: DNA-binding protein [Gammaproteobacteria bacterium]|nr:MAG: DNA-binding protein [Gammaproteobacteria bacterium]
MKGRLMSRKEVAEYLGVTPITVWRWMAAGYLPYIQIGKTKMYDRKKIERFLEEQSSVEKPLKGVRLDG